MEWKRSLSAAGILMVLVLTSGVAATGNIKRSQDVTPNTIIDLTPNGSSGNSSNKNGSSNNSSKDSSSSSSDKTKNDDKKDENTSSTNGGNSSNNSDSSSDGSNETNGTNGSKDSSNTNTTSTNTVPVQNTYAFNPSSLVRDGSQVWEKMTQINLFHKSEIVGDGQLVADADNEDKLLAPGTADTFTFELANTGDVALDYEINVESIVDTANWDVEMPIEMRMVNDEGEYIAGDEDTWILASKFGTVLDSGVIESNLGKSYTIEWQWPYEDSEYSDDEMDTTLGNIAAQDDLRLTVNINTLVSADTSGTPSTTTQDNTNTSNDSSDKSLKNKVSSVLTSVQMGYAVYAADGIGALAAIGLIVKGLRGKKKDDKSN